MTNPRYYENIEKCELCGKMVTSAKAHSSWTDEDGEFHCRHSDCEDELERAMRSNDWS
jgi:hypothetical protein